MNPLQRISTAKIVPVITFNDLDQVESTIEALINGQLPIGEICYRTACASEAIKLIKTKYPHFLLGAGTVINANQCEEAIHLGAEFIVSPGFSLDVLRVCEKHHILYLPGVLTPTEIIEALSHSLTHLKFFPAGVFGGLKAIKALSSAFPQVKFMPTGGVDQNNLGEFIKEKSIFAIGGSWLLKGDITQNCIEANKIVQGVR